MQILGMENTIANHSANANGGKGSTANVIIIIITLRACAGTVIGRIIVVVVIMDTKKSPNLVIKAPE